MIVTDHGQPTIEVRPYQHPERSPLEVLKESVAHHADPFEPVSQDDWESMK